ncbi:hypothetical protein EX30DRAFT_338343 [Ascodesmis nigricans]|uniref:Uncharacterized protein n=1 Tax=Ascodesmis nigricans TaxID=341454 RepID=A0A4S2N3M3_9PEZI|nr:hypothetical protein EX30DRAFT_338343 [Ascodesmis nigricans]
MILPPTTTTTTPTLTDLFPRAAKSTTSVKPLSPGATAGIVLASLFGIYAVAAVAFILWALVACIFVFIRDKIWRSCLKRVFWDYPREKWILPRKRRRDEEKKRKAREALERAEDTEARAAY